MSTPRYRFSFEYSYVDGRWSFCCIYADTLEEAQRQFNNIPSELYYIKTIDRTDNRHFAYEKDYEPEVCVYSA